MDKKINHLSGDGWSAAFAIPMLIRPLTNDEKENIEAFAKMTKEKENG